MCLQVSAFNTHPKIKLVSSPFPQQPFSNNFSSIIIYPFILWTKNVKLWHDLSSWALWQCRVTVQASHSQGKTAKWTQQQTIQYGDADKTEVQDLGWNQHYIMSSDNLPSFLPLSTLVRWLQKESLCTLHPLHTPTPDTLTRYARDNIVTPSHSLPLKLKF
jgi:hypothetical protein